ncbi:conserved hypothetical protein, partial [Perkinsus marinus ATCC 50983]
MYARGRGIVRASSYPYEAEVGMCKYSVTEDPNLQCLKDGDIYGVVDVPAANEGRMMEAVATGPVTVILYGSAPTFKHYKGGIIT